MSFNTGWRQAAAHSEKLYQRERRLRTEAERDCIVLYNALEKAIHRISAANYIEEELVNIILDTTPAGASRNKFITMLHQVIQQPVNDLLAVLDSVKGRGR